MERREFVKTLAAGGLIVPVVLSEAKAEWLAPQHYTGCPNTWKQAQKLMKETAKPGILVKIPQTPQLQSKYAAILNDKNGLIAELSSTHIVVCLSETYANQIYKQHSGKNLLLISKGMKEIKGHNWAVGSRIEMQIELVKIVYGENFARVKMMHDGLSVSPDQQAIIDKALVQLDAQSFKDRKKGRIYLSKNFAFAYTSIIMTRFSSPSVEVRESCKEILRSESRRSNAKLLGQACLHPLQQQVWQRGFAVECGMASMPKESREFINQLI
jgi:hypothetical protein